jgi:exodeoxyribonuclease V alpha subunit
MHGHDHGLGPPSAILPRPLARRRLAPEQEAAVRMTLTEPVSILTGGPGTGKTHCLKAILALARAKQVRCLLAAPTGRAAKQMEDATGLPATTLTACWSCGPAPIAARNRSRPT